ncbi:hypothetical protein M5K25_004014 [Dendrobium thyrsiflorum]|uniref:Uncharacterized protein n=1 Tax=Dendrobium thyrsiflorum TaxID=117978 RepID=A0ABD0VL22_DENTH
MQEGSSSRGNVDPRFTDASDQTAYHRYKSTGITQSKIVNPHIFTYLVLDLFGRTSLTFILTFAFPFSTEMLHLIVHNFYDILKVSITGDQLHILSSDPSFNWSAVNHYLRNTDAIYHDSVSSSLVKDARIIEHILRSSIIPKAGHLVTGFKLLLYSPSAPTTSWPIGISITRLHLEDEATMGEEEEDAPEPIPEPTPEYVPLCQHSQFDQLVEHFDQWETQFESYVTEKQQ